MKPVLLDLFCGAGGATFGYQQAGFHVIGIDSSPVALGQSPADEKWCGDWREGLDRYASRVAFIHASPPCQGYSHLSVTVPGVADKYPKLIAEVRNAIAGRPYVIENVTGARAEMNDPVLFCGSMFPACQADHPGYGRVGLHRHRYFEAGGFDLPSPGLCDHSLRSVPVYGHGSPGNGALKGPGLAEVSKTVMGIAWMRRDELVEAIPPAFTEYIGQAMLGRLTIPGNSFRQLSLFG